MIPPRKPTNAMLVYDLLREQPLLSIEDVMQRLNLTEFQVRQALRDLKGKTQCDRAPRYSILPTATRPIDGRGRRKA